jgi:hypothetical protein
VADDKTSLVFVLIYTQCQKKIKGMLLRFKGVPLITSNHGDGNFEKCANFLCVRTDEPKP